MPTILERSLSINRGRVQDGFGSLPWPPNLQFRDSWEQDSPYCRFEFSHFLALCLPMRVWVKISPPGTAGFGPCFHLPGFHLGYRFLTHSHVVHVLPSLASGITNYMESCCLCFFSLGLAGCNTTHLHLGPGLGFAKPNPSPRCGPRKENPLDIAERRPAFLKPPKL